MSYPTSGQIFKEPLDRITNTLGRVSLDTYYQVTFSFGKYNTWLLGRPGDPAVTKKGDFRQKLSLLCAAAELPGTSYLASSVQGDRQGIQEKFANFRQFPDLNLTFYVDADHVVIRTLETWMKYINPVQTQNRRLNAYTKLSYPDTYKEILHVTKFEKDFGKKATSYKNSALRQTTGTLTYEFVNVWPINMQSMPVRYGDSDVLRCSVQFAYDRYHTQFVDGTGSVNPFPNPEPEVKAADIINRNNFYNLQQLPGNVGGQTGAGFEGFAPADVG